MMKQYSLGTDTLIEIGTFLARRWSGMNATLRISQRGPGVRGLRISMPPLDALAGDHFQRYRQFRVLLWHESMRLKMCKKILSNDHAFGFILNTIETRRIELQGREVWRGMDEELIFNYSCQWARRPQAGYVHGRARIVEGFYQYFLFGGIKGEIAENHLTRIKKASRLAEQTLQKMIKDGLDTVWLEGKIPEIISALGVDSLLTIPIAMPWSKKELPLTEEELKKAMSKVTGGRGDFTKADPDAIMRGDMVRDEYKEFTKEDRRGDRDGPGADAIGVRVPSDTGADESGIYDLDLINGIKTRFRDWRTGWSEEHVRSGDELDEESYMEGHEPFFVDSRKKIKTSVAIMLDHSSSVSGVQLEYKKATLALCEVLSYLKVSFSVYAFSTVDKSVVCWQVKSNHQRWGNACAKRLAQIAANGSTPLADVYGSMYPVLQASRPGILLTMTDGEPSDPDAVRHTIRSLRAMGVGMVAMGLGPDTVRATDITSNLKSLGYERAIAVSRLGDIPAKVLGVLGGS